MVEKKEAIIFASVVILIVLMVGFSNHNSENKITGMATAITADTKITVFTVVQDPVIGKKQIKNYILTKFRPKDKFYGNLDSFASAIYDLGVKYGIDPGFALGVAAMESGIGKDPLANKCKNYFGIRGRQPLCSGMADGGFTKFSSEREGVEFFYKLIRENYLTRGQDTPNKFTAHKLCKLSDKNKFYCCGINHCYCCDDPPSDPTQYRDWVSTVTAVRKTLAQQKLEGEGISTGEVTGSLVCSEADSTKISSLSFGLKNCDNYRAVFEKYMEEYGITDVDLLLIYALTYQESGCRVDTGDSTRCGGIMQVDYGCLDRSDCKCVSDVDYAIKLGIQEFSQKYKALTAKRISGTDAFKLVLFGYNRGTAAGEKAAEYVKSGMNLHDAMAKSCDDYYPGKGITGICGSNWDYKKCCDSPGLGAGYPDTVLSHFEKACGELGGIVSYSESASGTWEGGQPVKYYLKPSFKVHIDYDLFGIYEQLVAEAKARLGAVEACFKEGKSPAECSGGFVVGIDEEKGEHKKDYIIKFEKSMPFNGKYYQEPVTYRFAIIISDTFAPPVVSLTGKYNLDTKTVELTWDKTSYDTEKYYYESALGSGYTTSTAASFQTPTPGAYTFTVKAYDNVGNALAPATTTVVVP